MRIRATSLLCALLLVAACGADAPVAPNAEIVPVGEQPPTTGQAARWTRVRYNATGTVTMSIANDVATLVFSDDFTVDQTPGPFVYVNTTNNANTGRPLRVGALKSRRGAQVYSFRVEPGVQYTHVLIWCDPFNVPMVEALLPR